MAPARIPEGSVFVPRRSGENVALALLEAAEEIGADRNLSVRTTTGGYHVYEEVAERYQANLPESDDDETTESEDDDESSSESVEDEERAAEEAKAKAAGDSEETKSEELEPLPVTAESSVAEIDDYASKQNPPVDLSSAKNRTEKIALLEQARAPKTPTAE